MEYISVSSEEENKYSDVVHCKYEEVRQSIFGDCPHVSNVSTPHNLCEEILNQLPNLNGKLILVLFNPEFYLGILRRYPTARVVMVTGSVNAYCMQKENGFKGIEHMILVDPFDLVMVEKAISKYKKYREEKNES